MFSGTGVPREGDMLEHDVTLELDRSIHAPTRHNKLKQNSQIVKQTFSATALWMAQMHDDKRFPQYPKIAMGDSWWMLVVLYGLAVNDAEPQQTIASLKLYLLNFVLFQSQSLKFKKTQMCSLNCRHGVLKMLWASSELAMGNRKSRWGKNVKLWWPISRFVQCWQLRSKRPANLHGSRILYMLTDRNSLAVEGAKPVAKDRQNASSRQNLDFLNCRNSCNWRVIRNIKQCTVAWCIGLLKAGKLLVCDLLVPSILLNKVSSDREIGFEIELKSIWLFECQMDPINVWDASHHTLGLTNDSAPEFWGIVMDSIFKWLFSRCLEQTRHTVAA